MIGIQDQYFGTEIEMTGITRQRAAEVVAELFGTEAVYEGASEFLLEDSEVALHLQQLVLIFRQPLRPRPV